MSATTEPADPAATVAPVRVLQPLDLGDPFRWLRAGWSDLLAAPWIGLFYGGCFWLMAVVLGAVFRNMPQYTLSIVSGCFLVGPFLAMGLYESSRRRGLSLPQSLGASLTCWDRHLGSMGMLVLVVLLLELLWGRASLVVFAVFFTTGMPSTASVLQAVFNPQNWEFVAVYTLVGGLFAGLVFSTWAAGLLVVGPWLGHASWHAYRASYRWRPLIPAALPPAPGAA